MQENQFEMGIKVLSLSNSLLNSDGNESSRKWQYTSIALQDEVHECIAKMFFSQL